MEEGGRVGRTTGLTDGQIKTEFHFVRADPNQVDSNPDGGISLAITAVSSRDVCTAVGSCGGVTGFACRSCAERSRRTGGVVTEGFRLASRTPNPSHFIFSDTDDASEGQLCNNLSTQ